MRTWSKDPRVQAEPGLFISEPGHRVPRGPQDGRKPGRRASGPGPLPFDSGVFPLENCCCPGAQRQRKEQTDERRKRNGAGERPSTHTHTHTHTLFICSSSNFCSVLGTVLGVAAGFPILVLRTLEVQWFFAGGGGCALPRRMQHPWPPPSGCGSALSGQDARNSLRARPKGARLASAACWRLGSKQDVTAPIPRPRHPRPATSLFPGVWRGETLHKHGNRWPGCPGQVERSQGRAENLEYPASPSPVHRPLPTNADTGRRWAGGPWINAEQTSRVAGSAGETGREIFLPGSNLVLT